ncbi:hypothetical protein ADK86_14955 [Streptomyces sp. NRRL F-5755]|uniref:hypothetical protein n=1 Tax=Streptomyces sp. NRRL F-5755 TaxID=1519475 RepID=UPI0006AF622E|nr:hypothetical protein [Streptomyces sp. NRRL F-5755]KOT99620.1 hypothetical protein ADK86_14955 [Streptomyces sp. NRRL F-5755]
MASIRTARTARTARTVAALAALPLATALLTGVAHADNGALAGNGSSAAATSLVDGGVGHNSNGNSTTTQQVVNGPGASNQNNNASVIGHGLTRIDQTNATVNFTNLW